MSIKRSHIASIISIILLLILVVPVPGQQLDTLKMASWNIRIFSDGSRDDTEVNQICQVLKDYDFISIVELRDEVVLQRTESMLQTMGRDYDYQISDAVGRGVKERYACWCQAGEEMDDRWPEKTQS